jgi:MFS family permease
VSDIKKLNNSIKAYYFSNALTSMSIALPHSVLTVLLLSKGLSLSDIAFIQSFYSLAIIIFEFPSGIMCDLMNRKKLYIASNLLLGLFFLMVMFFDGFILISAAWFLYGICTALESGTLDSDVMVNIKKLHQEGEAKETRISQFIRRSGQFSLISMLIASTVGSFLYFAIGETMYLISVMLVILSSTVVLKYFTLKQAPLLNAKGSVGAQIKEHISSCVSEIKNNQTIRLILILTAVSQIFFQTHFQFWQALFLDKQLDKEQFFIFYAVFQIIGVAVNQVHVDKIKIKRLASFAVVSIPFFSLLFYLMYSNDRFIFVALYCVLIVYITLLLLFYAYLYQSKVSIEHISSLTALRMSVSRISALITLWSIGVLLTWMDIQSVVILNFGLALVLTTVTLLVWLSHSGIRD